MRRALSEGEVCSDRHGIGMPVVVAAVCYPIKHALSRLAPTRRQYCKSCEQFTVSSGLDSFGITWKRWLECVVQVLSLRSMLIVTLFRSLAGSAGFPKAFPAYSVYQPAMLRWIFSSSIQIMSR